MSLLRTTVLLVLALAPCAAADDAWKAGTARVAITPEGPLWLAGYGGRSKPAEGKLHDLWLKVLALEAPGGRRAAVITADVCGFSKAAVEAVCGEVVVDYSLRLKDRYGPTTWVTAYAHELVAYMPSRRVWNEGGYEGSALYEYMLPADRWTPDLEDRILAAIEKLVAEVECRSRLPGGT